MTPSRQKTRWWAWPALAMLLVGVVEGAGLSRGQTLGLSQAQPLNTGLTNTGLTVSGSTESPNALLEKVAKVGLVARGGNSGVAADTLNNQGNTGVAGGTSVVNTGNTGAQAGSPLFGQTGGSSPFNYNNQWSNQWSNTHDPFGVMCPTQLDQTAFTLSNDPAGYPVDNITAELENRPDFAQFLLQEIVLPTDQDPPVPTDPRFDDAPPACPQQLDRLWSYTSTARQSRCWILQNFQEVILYATCLTEFCEHCGSKFTSSFNTKRNLCAKTYEVISVWSYCEALNLNERIIRERITIPKYCSCKKVQCMAQGFWRK